jgi:hypothetical protein
MKTLFTHAIATFNYKPNRAGNTTVKRSFVTIAIEQIEPGMYVCGFSWLAPSDNFSRKLGRDKAMARLRAKSPRHTSNFFTTGDSYEEILNTAVRTVETFAKHEGPSRWSNVLVMLPDARVRLSTN